MGSAGKKRAVLEPNCTQTGKTVTCSYTLAEVEAARVLGTELQESCYHTTEGITCVYNVSTEGLHIDEEFLAACSCEFSTVSTASVSHEDEIIQISETPCSEFELELGKCIEARVGAFKIGALYTADSITAISSVLQKCNNTEITPEIISAAREKLLPFTTVISATVPEAKLLLDNAKIPIEYPQDMEDVKTPGKTLLSLGPKFVLIKRDIFDEVAKETLHLYSAPTPRSHWWLRLDFRIRTV
ncbi:hypothetical protein DL95DRAFT_527213 [Leptodontidium sp. 2 PMI_412]|nr:hypothetical protein DL95DRAFT_527213 [Leptodontidium sp. 2 PMI_412]